MAHPESWPSHGARSGSKKGAAGGTTAAGETAAVGETAGGDDGQRDTLELEAAELSRLRELDPADGADGEKADDNEDRETVELTGPPPFSSEDMSSSPFSSPALGHDLRREENAPGEDGTEADGTEEDDADEERVAWHTIPVPPPSGVEDD